MSEGEDNDFQQKMVQCYDCGFSAPEETYDQKEFFAPHLYCWKSIQTNEFEYICSDCVKFVNQERVVWIAQEKATFLEIGQVVLAQVDEKEGEQFNDGWFRATCWKIDNERKECGIEFHEKSKGIWTKNYDGIKTLETFYIDPIDNINEVPLMHYYDNYADYAKRHNLFPEFDFVQVADDQINQELNQSLNQNLEDILITKKALEPKNNQQSNIVENHFGNNNEKNQQNSNLSDSVENFQEEQKVILINPWEFCYVRGETILKNGVIDDYYTQYTQQKNYYKTELNDTKSKRRKYSKELHDNSVKRFFPLDYHFFNVRMQVTEYQRIATNFFMDQNNQVTMEDYISGLTPRKNFTKLYNDIGKIFSYFVPQFEKCLRKIYEKYNIQYSKELHDLRRLEPPKKCQKYMMEQSFLTDRKMQVFVEAVDYKIQPGKKFQGEWKIEGQQQENIVAIGIYCCEISEDLSDFGLEFRRGINDSEISNLQKSYGYEPPPFDTNNAEIILGSVHIKKNRCIVFPNDVQHRVTEFGEKNYENVKNCKILYFFLVDPELEIVSSADIQNQNWEENKVQILIELQKIAKRILGQSFSKEVVEKIMLGAKTGFNQEEELAHRRAAVQGAQKYNERINQFATRRFGYLIEIW